MPLYPRVTNTSAEVHGKRLLFDTDAAFVSVSRYGAVGDGVTDDTAAIAAAIASGNSLLFNPGKTYLVNQTLNFGQHNRHYFGFGSTILYGWAATTVATTGLMIFVTGNRVTFEGITFSGNNKQVDKCLIYIADNVLETRFINCRIGDIAGTHVNNETNDSSANQYGIVISPYGVEDFLIDGCEFRNITNQNNGVGVAQVEGYGFAGGILVGIEYDWAQPVTVQGIVTSGTIVNSSFRNIQTILAGGLTETLKATYDDADGIRFYGDVAGATRTYVKMAHLFFYQVSKRAIKGSVSNFCSVHDIIIEATGCQYGMTTALKVETGWTVDGVKILASTTKLCYQVFQTHDADNFYINNVYVSHCGYVHVFAPTVAGQTLQNITFSNINCPYVLYAGFFPANVNVTTIKNVLYQNIKLVAAPTTTGISLLAPIHGSAYFDTCRFLNLEFINGEVYIPGEGTVVDGMTITIDNAAYMGVNSGTALFRFGGTNNSPLPSHANYIKNLKVNVDLANGSWFSPARTIGMIYIEGSYTFVNNLTLSISDANMGALGVMPHIVIKGSHMVVDTLNYYGRYQVDWMVGAAGGKFDGSVLRNASRLGGFASASPFIKSNWAQRTVIQNVVDYCTGAHKVIDLTGIIAGQDYNIQNVVSRTTADPINTTVAFAGESGIALAGNKTTLRLTDGIAIPANGQVGEAIIYIDVADGDLKIKFSDNVVKTITTDV